MEKQKRNKKIWVPVISVLTVLVIIANVVTAMFYNTITYYFKGANTTYDSADAKAAKLDAEGVVKEIVANGAVLLKNEDGTSGKKLLPLETDAEDKTKINVFGWDSVGWVIGGSGSGTAGNEGVVNLVDALKEKYDVNQELIDLYTNYKKERPETGVGSADWTITELPVEKYSEEVMQNAKNYSDVAVLAIGRVGGEGNDLPTDMSAYGGKSDEHYLELGDAEKELVEKVCSNFDNVIVLINSPATMELGWVDEYDSIKSVMYVGLTGSTGSEAIPQLLSGEINPSGKTVDIYAYDLTTAPSYVNAAEAGTYKYTNTKQDGFSGETYDTAIEYQEGIYIGYRYYETRGVTDGEEWYQSNVQYPFGYGLSYTEFSEKMSDLKVNDDGTISVDITVRNVGDCEGKDVVELYYTAPYIENGIEKSHVVLLDFAKTATLQPAQAEELTFTFAPEDMASFDYITEGCYVLDAGDYEIKLMSDSHNVIDSRIYNVPEKIVYNNDNKRTTDDVAAVSLFQDAEGTDITYLSRSDWEGTWPKASEDREASDDLLNAKNDFDTEDTYKNDEDQMPVTGEDNGLKLADMTGLSYDDEKWELLLNEMTVEEMNNLVSFGGYQNIAVNSIGKPNCIDLDGPQGINEANQSTKQTGAASYPSEVVTACTWDTEIAELMGMSIGKEALSYNVNGWYAPACNIHRSPFGGRVFEYYSEDPLLSGKMSASCVQGAGKYGVYCYVKHFAVNETETHRDGLYTWLNEQSLREIYLKPFEIAVKEGNATGIMSAFNRLGTVWCGGNKALMTNVLRDEWGFRGAVVTDYYIPFATFMNPYSGIMAGNDLWLAPIDGMNAEINPSNATIVSQLRNASHNILYMVANSNAVDTSYAENANIEQPVTAEKESLPLWAVLFYGIFDLVYVIVLVVIIVKARKNKQIKVTEA